VFPASGWQPRYTTQYCCGQRVGAGVAVGPAGVGGSVGNGFFVGAGRRVSVGGGASVAGIAVGGGSVGINSVGTCVGARVGRVWVGARNVAVASCDADAAGLFCATRGVNALESKSAVRHAKSAPLTLNANNQIRNERIFKTIRSWQIPNEFKGQTFRVSEIRKILSLPSNRNSL